MKGINEEPVPTAEEWLVALQQLDHEKKIPSPYRAMLVANYLAKDHIITAWGLKEAAGYNEIGGVNLHYGILGKLLAEKLKREPTRRGHNNSPQWTMIHCFGNRPESDDDEYVNWEWTLKPQIVQALQRLDWTQQVQNELKLDGGYTEKAIQEGFEALPHLVAVARQRKTITYSELADKIGVHHRAARHFLGYIRDEICARNGHPYITVIVLNKGTDLPGGSFLPEGTDHLTPEEYRAKFEEIRDEVFKYPYWGELLESLNLEPVPFSSDDLNEIGRTYGKLLAKRPGGGEGDTHRQLKEYVSAHPEKVGILAQNAGAMEHDFISGDRCDILFDLAYGKAIIEIKVGDHEGELVRGIYQAVKYRALLEAEEGQGESYPVHVLLVAHNISEQVKLLAKRFGITCRVIPVAWIGV